MELIERIAAKYRIDPVTGCHLWTASTDQRGYGMIRVDRTRVRRAHRVIWELTVGPVPDGLELDHFKCDTPSCVNPEHLRPVTTRENTLRSNNACARNLAKTHCPQGHPYDEVNTRQQYKGVRRCHTCTMDRQRSRRERERNGTA